ncbi:MAG: putative glycosyltransferase [Microgenomates group bacterium GW2011_GWC1_39_7b]|nr:MAG: putative glycosyltransferase [Microgenomates group bacterium GW2011_GWC1_39_7b]
MKVSVIIPAYNEQASIAACLQSLQNQSFKDLEIIVVDDGSTDKTFDVLSKFKMQSSKFKILDQNHEGAGMARNLGVKNATGKILVFVDADMVFDKEFINANYGWKNHWHIFQRRICFK